ncbi:hypothetical protein [Lacinutrix himadriensis]|uniref:hypothetical protein n=1 Tax=Lacinutrix himadriensis TaxID=641549 RepID=UPI000AF12D23|nr:hypothetical protein [Lacinutrix himadriensis]
MHRSKIIISIFLIVGIGSLFFLQNKFKTEVIHVLDTKLPENITLEYATIHANVFNGTVKLESLSAKVLHADKNLMATLNANTLKVDGFSLWQFIFNNTIAVDNIVFTQPKLEYHSYSEKQREQKDTTEKSSFNKIITIHNFSVVNGAIQVKDAKSDTRVANVDRIDFNVSNLHFNAETIQQKIPFNYQDYQLTTKQFFMNLSTYEVLKIDDFSLDNKGLHLKNIFLETKFSKEVLSTKITVERDHVNLHIPEVVLHKLDFGFHKDVFFVTADSGEIEQPNLSIYRDKRVADDMRIKSMYSKMLRDLPIDLSIHNLDVNNGNVAYAERLDATTRAGAIFFKAVNAKLTNLGNTYKKGEKTKIAIRSNFMDKAPMHLDIHFDVTNKQDAFLASGAFENFDAEIANTFFETNLNAKAEGEIEQIYFTFSGNNASAKGDLKMKYEAFKFEILNDKNKVNTFLTAIGNVFINDGSKTGKDGYRHGEIGVNRNTKKSFFNYLWINVQSGLISTLTGKGSK